MGDVQFRDDKLNSYYIEDEWLMVHIAKLNIKRRIGKVSVNLITGKANLTVYRKSTEQWRYGYLISAVPFENMDFNRLTLIEDMTKMYVLDWDSVKTVWKSWTFNPDNGMEKQMIVPQHIWSEVRPCY